MGGVEPGHGRTTTPGRGPLVVHVTADYPDPVVAAKTQAIKALINLTEDRFDNYVFSLNRTSDGILRHLGLAARGARPALVARQIRMEQGEAWQYRAPPYGIFHRTSLERLGDAIAGAAARLGRARLLVAHKLTVEGIAVWRASAAMGLPYALSIQGDTDTKILSARPDLRSLYTRVFHEAAVVVSLAPWSLERLEALLGRRVGPSIVIPCPTDIDDPLAPNPGGQGLVSVFHLASARRKNLAGLARAFRLLGERLPDAKLAVIGGGSETERRAAKAMAGVHSGISFAGAAARDEVRSMMNGAAGFVLPSLRETFGMVFVEALFAGCPIIYPRGRAVDGYFDGLSFAIAVDPRDPAEIAAAMHCVLTETTKLKASLGEWQAAGELDRFCRRAIGDDYRNAIEQALGAQAVPAIRAVNPREVFA